jgi:small subunit ribosomal protein S20
MANHKSSLKRIRSSETRRLRNRYYSKTMRNAVRKFRTLENKTEASEKLPKLVSMIDKLAKKSIIHKNKAGNLKSKLTKYINRLA